MGEISFGVTRENLACRMQADWKPVLWSLSQQQLCNPSRVAHVTQRCIRFACFEFFQGIMSGGNCEDLGADGSAALDVGWGVADYPHGFDRIAVSVGRSLGGEAGDVVAVSVDVAEGSEAEVMIDVEMLHFHPAAAFEVAGQ